MKRYAPEGYVWVCAACGKVSHTDRYGPKGKSWWDASCVMNSVLVKEENITYNEEGTRVFKVSKIENEDEICAE